MRLVLKTFREAVDKKVLKHLWQSWNRDAIDLNGNAENIAKAGSQWNVYECGKEGNWIKLKLRFSIAK